MTAARIERQLKTAADPSRARALQRFFESPWHEARLLALVVLVESPGCSPATRTT